MRLYLKQSHLYHIYSNVVSERELTYKPITEVTTLLTSVFSGAVYLFVERDRCFHCLFVCNNGNNGTTLRKWTSFAGPLCAIVLDARWRGKWYSIPKFAVL